MNIKIYLKVKSTPFFLHELIHSKHLIHSCCSIFSVSSICIGHFLSHNLHFTHLSFNFNLNMGFIESSPSNAPIGQKYLQNAMGYMNPNTINPMRMANEIRVPDKFVRAPIGHTEQ